MTLNLTTIFHFEHACIANKFSVIYYITFLSYCTSTALLVVYIYSLIVTLCITGKCFVYAKIM